MTYFINTNLLRSTMCSTINDVTIFTSIHSRTSSTTTSLKLLKRIWYDSKPLRNLLANESCWRSRLLRYVLRTASFFMKKTYVTLICLRVVYWVSQTFESPTSSEPTSFSSKKHSTGASEMETGASSVYGAPSSVASRENRKHKHLSYVTCIHIKNDDKRHKPSSTENRYWTRWKRNVLTQYK
jgi:hypothetical protein